MYGARSYSLRNFCAQWRAEHFGLWSPHRFLCDIGLVADLAADGSRLQSAAAVTIAMLGGFDSVRVASTMKRWLIPVNVKDSFINALRAVLLQHWSMSASR